MSISGIRKEYKRGLIYVPITLFIMLFSFIYEKNGHGVYSNFMIFACLPTLIGGVAVWLIAGALRLGDRLGKWFINLWTGAIITATLGMIFRGVLDIYGTSSRLGNVYWILTGALVIGSIVSVCIYKQPEEKKEESSSADNLKF